MFSLNTKSTGIFFCLATILFLLKPLSAKAQLVEQSDVFDKQDFRSLNVKADAKKLAQFEPEGVEVDVVEPVRRSI